MEKITMTKEESECCIVCEEEKVLGIHLFESFICECCEKEIRSTDPKDAYYHYYLKKLKKIKIPTSG